MGDGRMWPEGSDSTAMPGKTRAKAEAWTTWPAISEKSKAMEAAADQDGRGRRERCWKAVQGEMKNLGGACGACHKEYREEE